MERAKIHPIVIGAAAAVLVSSALGAAAITGVLPVASSRPEAAAPAVCARCGVVESVRATADEMATDAKNSTLYRVTVRMDDGSRRLLALPSAAGYAVGDRVRVLNGSRLERV